MTPLTLYLAKLIGAVFIVMAAMLASRGRELEALLRRMVSDPGIVLFSGAARVVTGLAIIIGHDEWGGALAIAVTLFGWLLFLSGLLLLFAREERLVALVETIGMGRRALAYAGGLGLVGLWLVGEALLGSGP
ncbi:MAG TPA: hypothetical protein VK446_11660 [Methylocystis sp.]|nr:hypothetical protein [Methylocystis sp.]